MKKNNTPRRKLLTRECRLVNAKDWLKIYRGNNLISGYAKWFGVDKICALGELKILGVQISIDLKNNVIESHRRKIDQQRKDKEERVITDTTANYLDCNFAFIAGFTEGGFPYDLTME